jgi:flagellar hook protein FlgE
MEQGPLQNTGRTLDLAIQGEGFFMVTDGTTEYLTRDGAFFVDAAGNLVNSMGFQVQDINLGGGTQIAELSISPDGHIIGRTVGSDTDDIDAELFIYTVPNPEGLKKVGNSLYIANTETSGDVTGDLTPGADGAGTIESGYLEMSNTDLSEEFTTMITTQRGYQASARIITVSDTLLEELIQLKR